MSEPKSARSAATTKGLARLRHLQENDKPEKTKNASLPNGWYYNEQNEKDFWSQIETNRDEAHYAVLEESNRKVQNISNIEDSSKKINQMIDSFSQIDNDFLMKMLQIAPDVDENDEIDSNAILDSTRNQVIQYCVDMNDISKSQELIVNQMREWFKGLEKADLFLNREVSGDEEIPDIQETFNQLQDIISAASAKSEQAAAIHNDAISFWQRQISLLKQVIAKKDISISQLKEALENNEKAKVKKQKKKQALTDKEKKMELQQETFDKLLRQNEELKMQIRTLKQTVSNAEAQNALLSVKNLSLNESTVTTSEARLLDTYKYEADARIVFLEGQVKQYSEEIVVLKQKVNDLQKESKHLEKSSNEKEQKIKELESSLQKYINLLNLEREKPSKVVYEKRESNEDQLYLEISKLKQQISQERNEHSLHIKNVQEIERQKNALERSKIIESFSSGDPQQGLSTIFNEYEKKLTIQKEDYEKIFTGMTKDFDTKFSILTNQYESRIKAMNEEHQRELIDCQSSINFEIQKAKLILNDDFNLQLSTITKNNSDHEASMKRNIDSLEAQVESLNKENEMLHDTISKITGKTSAKNKGGLQIKENRSLSDFGTESNYIENWIQKMKIEKKEMNEQHEWVIEQMKKSYESELKKQLENEQAMYRRLLQSILHSIDNYDENDPDTPSMKEVVKNVADAFIELNDSILGVNEQEIMIPVKEANRRTKILNDRIIKLQIQLQESSKDTSISYEDEIEKLNKKISFFENLKRGNESAAMKDMIEMQENYANEIKEKNALIEELTNVANLPATFDGEFFATEIFSVENEEEEVYQYEEEFVEEEERLELEETDEIDSNLVRSTPEFITPEDSEKVQEENDEQETQLVEEQETQSVEEQETQLVEEQETQEDNDQNKEVVTKSKEVSKIQSSIKNVQKKPNKRLTRSATIKPLPAKIETAQESVVVPAVITVENSEGKKIKEVRTTAKVEAPAEETPVKRTIKVKDKMKLEPSVFQGMVPPIPIKSINKQSGRTTPQKKSAKRPNSIRDSPKVRHSSRKPVKIDLEISFSSVAVNIPVQHKLFIAPGSKKVNINYMHVDVFGLKPGRKPPLIVENDDFARSIIESLQQYLKNIALAQLTGETNYAKEEFLNKMQVALVDSNQRIILSDKSMCTEYHESDDDEEVQSQRIEFEETNIQPETEEKRSDEENDVNQRIEVYQRPAPTPLELDLSDLDTPIENLTKDPFTSSILMLAEVIRFINGLKDNAKYIKQTMSCDLDAYEAYEETQRNKFDQVSVNYMEQVKESCDCYQQNINMIDKMQDMCMKTLKVLRESKRLGVLLKEKTEQTKEFAAEQQFKAQEIILKNVISPHDSSLPEPLRQMIALDKIEDALNFINEINIELSEDDKNILAFIQRGVREKKELLTNEKPVEQKDIDYLIKVTHNLITAIKPNVNKPLEELENKFSEYRKEKEDEMRGKISKYKNAYVKDHSELKQARAKIEVLEKQIKLFKEKIQETEESNQNSISLYQAQIQTMSSVLEKLSPNYSKTSKSPSELANNIMKEVTDLQVLLDVSTSEKEALRLKASQSQETLVLRNEEIEALSSINEGLEKELSELKESISKNNEIVLFHDVDMEKIQKERDADTALNREQMKQLNDAMNSNNKMRERINDLEKHILQLKWDLEQKENQIDDLSVRVALGSYQDNKTRKSELTQTIMRLVPRPKIETVQENDDVPINAKVNLNTSKELSNSITVSSSESFTQPLFLRQSNISLSTTNPILQSPLTISQSPESNKQVSVPNINISFTSSSPIKQESNSSLGEDAYMWVSAPVDEDDDFFDSKIIETDKDEERVPNIMSEKAPEIVHSPLNWKKPKPRRASIIETVYSQKGKQIKKPSSIPKSGRPKTSFANSQIDKLAIGDVSSGVRPLQGNKEKVRSTTSIKTATDMKAAFSLHPTDVPPIKSSRTFKSDHPNTSRTSASKKSKQPTTGRTNDVPEYNPNDYETIRITNVKYGNPSKTPRSIAPMSIKPFGNMYVNCDPMSTSTTERRQQSQETVINELRRIITKHRETISKQNEEIDEKNSLINELRTKLADALKQSQQLRIDVVRAEDKSKRCNIRYENVQSRLEIAMKEIGFREEIISDLKREINNIKRVIPSKEAMRKLNNARDEQKRLKREAEMQKELMKMSEKGLSNKYGCTETVKKHIMTLMNNTQKSLNRNEAKRRMWKNIEEKQVMGALNALSLISSDVPDVEDFEEMFSQPKNPIYGLLSSRHTSNETSF